MMRDMTRSTEVRLRVPDDCRGISVGGELLPIQADGSLHTDATTAASLEAHGAVPWQDTAPNDPATMSRDALIDFFMARTRAALTDQDTETIRASLVGAADEEPPAPTRDDIAGMNRAEVLAFLQDREVQAPSNASLTDLRTRAVATLAD